MDTAQARLNAVLDHLRWQAQAADEAHGRAVADLPRDHADRIAACAEVVQARVAYRSACTLGDRPFDLTRGVTP